MFTQRQSTRPAVRDVAEHLAAISPDQWSLRFTEGWNTAIDVSGRVRTPSGEVNVALQEMHTRSVEPKDGGDLRVQRSLRGSLRRGEEVIELTTREAVELARRAAAVGLGYAERHLRPALQQLLSELPRHDAAYEAHLWQVKWKRDERLDLVKCYSRTFGEVEVTLAPQHTKILGLTFTDYTLTARAARGLAVLEETEQGPVAKRLYQTLERAWDGRI